MKKPLTKAPTARKVGRSRRERSGGNSTATEAKVLPPGALSRAEVNDLVSAIASLSRCADVLADVSKLMDDALDRARDLCESINDRMSLVTVTPVAPVPAPCDNRGDGDPPGLRRMDDEEWQALMGETPPPKRQLSFYTSEG